MHGDSGHHDREHGDAGGHRCQADVVLVGPEREHDEHDLEPLEQHALERNREGVGIEPGTVDAPRRAGGRELLLVRLALIVERLQPGGAQDRLAKPLQAEDQQQRPDDQPQHVDRQRGQRRPERGHKRRQRDDCRACPVQRRGPAAGGADCEHDRQRLDRLYGAGDEHRQSEAELGSGHDFSMPG